MRSNSARLDYRALNFRRAGDVRALAPCEPGELPMNAHNRAEEIEETVDMDDNAASQVEDGIREFVRNDIAYLRRPPVPSPDTAPDAHARSEEHTSELQSPGQPVCRRPLE